MGIIKKIHLLNVSEKFDLAKFSKPKDDINDNHKYFEGMPKKHPFDDNLIILIPNPHKQNDDTYEYYEFSINSIGAVKQLETLTNEKGESIHMVRLWVERGMPAIRSVTFIVD